MKRASMVFGLFAACLLAAGCSTSEESGAANRSTQPQQEPAVQPPAPSPGRETSVRADSAALRPGRKVPRVRSSQDTMRVSTARRSRPAAKSTPLVKPPNAMYTVQIGAFRRASYALALQRAARAKAGTTPVFNNYFASDKLYRVSVGKLATRRQAASLRSRLLDADSVAFRQCWVTYIKR